MHSISQNIYDAKTYTAIIQLIRILGREVRI